MKIPSLIIAFALLGMSFGANGFAQTASNSQKGSMSKRYEYRPPEGERINAFTAENIIGSKVQNMQGVDLGVIKDVVIDVDTGQVLYAILDVGGFLGVGGKLFPVPWHSLAPLPSEGIFFMNISKEKLEKAPGFNKDNLPDMGDVHWGATINQFYEASQEQRGYSYYDYEYGYAYGPEMYPGVAQEDPFAKTFDPASIKKITGMVIKVDQVIPKSGIISQMELELIVHPDGKEPVPVFVGPVWYVVSPERRRPFKSGDEVTVTGSWVAPGGTPFLIATAVTKGNETLQLRHEDGKPMWNAWKISLENRHQ
jgi:sporulation protein YlmC with PRC-barrel domain